MKTIYLSIIVLMIICLSNGSEQIRRNILKTFEDKPTKEYFKVFHMLHSKEYQLDSDEGLRRYKIFKSNVKIVKETNNKNLSYKLRVNKFADMTAEEFREKVLIVSEQKNIQVKNGLRLLRERGFFENYYDTDEEKLFEKSKYVEKQNYTPIDWTKLFGPVRNQKHCGSCWTFSTTGVIEAFLNKKNNSVGGYLSPQQLVDCDKKDNGCKGGDFHSAFTYIQENGLLNESDYPYTSVQNSCKISSDATRIKISSFDYCSNYSNSSAKKCTFAKVYKNLEQGPASIGIDGSVIQLYDSGIFTADCREDNHAVIMVGYGIEEGVEFFKVRNSWGSDWGEDGYIRIARNELNSHSCFTTNESYTVKLS